MKTGELPSRLFIPIFKLHTGKGCVVTLRPVLPGLSTLSTIQSSFSFPVTIKEDSEENEFAENPLLIQFSVKDLCGGGSVLEDIKKKFHCK